jgi:hypothetical protein
MPHLIHVFVSIAALLLFALMAGMFTLAEMGELSGRQGTVCSLQQKHPQRCAKWFCRQCHAELNPLSRNWLAMAHSK